MSQKANIHRLILLRQLDASIQNFMDSLLVIEHLKNKFWKGTEKNEDFLILRTTPETLHEPLRIRLDLFLLQIP